MMKEVYMENEAQGLSDAQLEEGIRSYLSGYHDLRKVLILPPDYTRCFSYAGVITQMIFKMLAPAGVTVHVMPALGTHGAMDEKEKKAFFADVIPEENFLVHHWQTDTVKLGTVPASYISEISGGLFGEEIDAELNHLLVDGGYDLILSVGQVVPHEVVGMSNYSKNIFVGVGGRSMINNSHMLGAVCGLENVIGVTDSPPRLAYDYAQKHFLDGKVPVVYIQTVTTQNRHQVIVNGCYIGTTREPYERAAILSQKLNIVHLPKRVKKVVCYLEPDEFKSTWVGNKAIYRTCKMIDDGGELLILAPNVRSFGENEEADRLIRKYGYRGRDYVLQLYREGAFAGMSMVAAHLIHGSSGGRYTITYAVRPEYLSGEDIESVGYRYAEYENCARRYSPENSREGWNRTEDGEEYYYIGKPATGLWQVD